MNRLVIIGNGFDLAHRLKTSYKDFIYWYLEEFFKSYMGSTQPLVYDELLCFQSIYMAPPTHYPYPTVIGTEEIHDYFQKTERNPVELLNKLKTLPDLKISIPPLMDTILNNVETKGWTDIESDYYMFLKNSASHSEISKGLNQQMDFLRTKLAEYLKTLNSVSIIGGFEKHLRKDIIPKDVAQSSKKLVGLKPICCDNVMLLDFNYTHTTNLYTERYWFRDHIVINHIHGSLDKPGKMIFGYGDEMDKDFKSLEERNDNELLRNMKSVKYLETSHYRDMLSFIEGGLFQVYIMGHSCGNSDRTLLNTIFEHPNCVSIKPFCYINAEDKDNYSELTQNIYRNFKDKTLFRDRVVNREQCTTLTGEALIL